MKNCVPSRPSRAPLALILAILLPFGGCASVGKWALVTISPMNWEGEKRIELPLARDEGGRPVVAVRALGQDTMALIDSGSGASSITPAMAAATGARVRGSMRINGQRYPTAQDLPVRLGPASFKLGLVVVGDKPIDTQFTFGQELFLQAIVEMDFDANLLTLIHPDAFTPPVEDPLPVRIVGGVPTVPFKLDGHERAICGIVDTGFNAGVALADEVVNGLALPAIPGRNVVGEGFGGVRVEAPALAPLQAVRIGDQIYRDVPAVVFPGMKGCDGLLGMAILSRHRLVFDLRKGRVWLLPRSGV